MYEPGVVRLELLEQGAALLRVHRRAQRRLDQHQGAHPLGMLDCLRGAHEPTQRVTHEDNRLAALRGEPARRLREAREVTLRFPRKKLGAMAVIDGELVKLADKVDLKIHPGALQVVMPKAAVDAEPEAPTEIVLTPA